MSDRCLIDVNFSCFALWDNASEISVSSGLGNGVVPGYMKACAPIIIIQIFFHSDVLNIEN